jgi:hypothetical protein
MVLPVAKRRPDVAEELAALRQQLNALSEQVTALALRQEELNARVNQTLPRQPEGKPADHSVLPPAQEVLARCGQDILRVLREVGRPLTTLEILGELVHRHLNWRESTVSHTLAELIDQGLVQEKADDGPRRHMLVTPR